MDSETHDAALAQGGTLQPLVVELPGAFWDCQLYAGRLIGFGYDETIQVIRWEELIETLELPSVGLPLVNWAFSRNDFFYRTRNWMKRNVATDLKDVVGPSFDGLRGEPLLVSADAVDDARESRIDNQVPFPHSDSHAYNYDLFVSGRSGVWKSVGFLGAEDVAQSTFSKVWDAPVHDMATRLGTLAMAAGDEGLWETAARRESANGWVVPQGPQQVSDQHCTKCDYMFLSVFCSSHVNGGFLADFSAQEAGHNSRRRALRGVKSSDELWGKRDYSWGLWNRICQASGGVLDIKSFFETLEEDEISRISPVRSLELSGDQTPVSAELTPFGAVVEWDEQLDVITNNRETVTFAPPVRWRCLPRSKFYFDLLLLIYEDRISVVSFVEDSLMARSRYTLGTSVPKTDD